MITLAFAYILLSIIAASKGGDFDVFLEAATKLNNHQNIYAPPFIKPDLQYYYSPLFALLLIPFSNIGPAFELFWLLLSGYLLFRIYKCISAYLDLRVVNNGDNLLLFFISLFFMLRFILYNITMIQVTIFLLWAILESIELIQKNKYVIGSLLLAFAINIKLMPIVILPYLIYRKKFNTFLLVLSFSLIYLYLPAIFIGYDFNNFLLHEWWAVINPSNKEHLIEAGTKAQSLVGMIPVFLTETTGQLNISRNIISLNPEKAILITNVIRATLVILTVFFLKSPFIKNIDRLSEIRAIGYICLLTPMIFPHQQIYAFIFLYPICVYLTYYCIVLWRYDWNAKSKMYVFSLLTLSTILSPIIGSDVIGRRAYDLVHHFRLLGIVVLLLIIYAAISSPQKVKQIITNQSLQAVPNEE